MEQRIRKEFRALLAPWLLALLLATTALWWRPGTAENAAWILWLACFSQGMVLLAVAAFGNAKGKEENGRRYFCSLKGRTNSSESPGFAGGLPPTFMTVQSLWRGKSK